MSGHDREEAVRRAQGLPVVGGIGGRRRRISDDNPLMQGNLDPVDDPDVDSSRDAIGGESSDHTATGSVDEGTRSDLRWSSRSVSAPVGSGASKPVMRPSGARDVVSQSLGDRSPGIVSDLSILEARRAARLNRSRGTSSKALGVGSVDSPDVGPKDVPFDAQPDVSAVSPVGDGSVSSGPSRVDSVGGVRSDASGASLLSAGGESVVAGDSGSDEAAVRPEVGIETGAVSDSEKSSSKASARTGRSRARARASSVSREESKSGRSSTRGKSSGKGGAKARSSAKTTSKGKPVRNVVQIRDFSRELYEVVSDMFPSGFSQTRVMNGFVAMHTGRLDCIESDKELVAAVRDIMNGDVSMIGIMDEVLALREDMDSVRKSLTKTRRYSLMGALGTGAALDVMAKTHGAEQGLSAEELAALSDDVTRTMDVLDSSARDFESEEFGRGRQIRGGRR